MLPTKDPNPTLGTKREAGFPAYTLRHNKLSSKRRPLAETPLADREGSIIGLRLRADGCLVPEIVASPFGDAIMVYWQIR